MGRSRDRLEGQVGLEGRGGGRKGDDDCSSRAYVAFLTFPAVLTFPAFLAFVSLQDLVDEKKVRQECAEMDRGIQVVDHL